MKILSLFPMTLIGLYPTVYSMAVPDQQDWPSEMCPGEPLPVFKVCAMNELTPLFSCGGDYQSCNSCETAFTFIPSSLDL